MTKKKTTSTNSLIKYSGRDLDIAFPQNDILTETEMSRTQKSISHYGVALNDGRTFLNKKALHVMFVTDQKGVNKVYGRVSDVDKYIDGNDKYISTSAVNKEISDRIQEPRDPYEREILKYNEKCINTFRNSDKLENERSIENARIRKQLPKIGKEIIKEKGITRCEATDEKFENDAQAHHLERKADNPRRALDKENIKMVKKQVHIEIHQTNHEGEEGFEEFVKMKKK